MKLLSTLSAAALAMFGLLCSCASDKNNSLDLSGEWRFQIDSLNVGIDQNWASTTLDDVISLPGTMDQAGKGTPNTLEPALEKPQVLHLTRKYSYVDPAWYQRDIVIPESMAGKPLRLKLERILWQSDLWVDGLKVGDSQESVTTPHRYDIPALDAGKHTLTLRIDNSKIHDTSVDNLCHSYTNDTQVMWNGVLGHMSLVAVPDVEITRVAAYPDINNKNVRVKVTVANHTDAPVTTDLGLRARHAKVVHEVTVAPGTSEIELDLQMPESTPLWNEFSPEVIALKATLPDYDSAKVIDFGFREITTDGSKMLVNGVPVFLRGTLECCIFPLTGTPPTDEEGWEKVFETAKAYGLNHLRFHSWCPPEAAFRVADRMGVYVQVELPQWSLTVGSDPATTDFVRDEYFRIADEYGNHPSFILMTCGNELQPDFDVLNSLVAEMRDYDPRHLYAASTFTFEKGHGKHPEPNDQFFITQYTDWGWVRGQGVFDAEPPCFNKDYKHATDSVGVPLISHEIGQYAVYPNLAEIDKYTGTLLPLNFLAVRDDLTRKGLIDKASDMTLASGKLAALLYKEEIERALKSPGFSGFQLLDLHDFPGQGTALVGLLDAFWDSKGIITPDEFRQFCAPIVALSRFDKAVYTNGETFDADIEVANYSDGTLSHAGALWAITDTDGNELASGFIDCAEAPVGGVTRIGHISPVLDFSDKAQRLTFSVAIQDSDIRNEWPIWVFPEHNADTLAADGVTIATDIDSALAELQNGGKVLLTPKIAETKGLRGKFVPVFWSPVHFPDQAGAMGLLCDPSHPALADFPTEMHTNWQWWHLLKNSRFVCLDSIEGATPIVNLVDNFSNNRRLAALFEGKVGNGSLLFSSMELTGDDLSPEQRQMLYSLLRYMVSDAFNPTGNISPEELKMLKK